MKRRSKRKSSTCLALFLVSLSVMPMAAYAKESVMIDSTQFQDAREGNLFLAENDDGAYTVVIRRPVSTINAYNVDKTTKYALYYDGSSWREVNDKWRFLLLTSSNINFSGQKDELLEIARLSEEIEDLGLLIQGETYTIVYKKKSSEGSVTYVDTLGNQYTKNPYSMNVTSVDDGSQSQLIYIEYEGSMNHMEDLLDGDEEFIMQRGQVEGVDALLWLDDENSKENLYEVFSENETVMENGQKYVYYTIDGNNEVDICDDIDIDTIQNIFEIDGFQDALNRDEDMVSITISGDKFTVDEESESTVETIVETTTEELTITSSAFMNSTDVQDMTETQIRTVDSVAANAVTEETMAESTEVITETADYVNQNESDSKKGTMWWITLGSTLLLGVGAVLLYSMFIWKCSK